MNVMTVGEILPDVSVKIQQNEEAAPGFASELDRASSKESNAAGNAPKALKADKKTQAENGAETKKAEDKTEEEPEEPKKVHGMNSVPVVLSEQQVLTPEDAQAALPAVPVQANGAEGIIIAENIMTGAQPQSDVQNAVAAVIPDIGSEPAAVMQNQAVQSQTVQAPIQNANAAGDAAKTQAQPLMQDAQQNMTGNTAGQAVLTTPENDAQAFAAQALREIAELQKAANLAQETVPAAEQNAQAKQPVQTVKAVQTVNTVQTAEDIQVQIIPQPVQNAEQPSSQNVQQQDAQQQNAQQILQNTLAADSVTDAASKEQTADGENKRSEQDGTAKNSGTVQVQTTAGTSAAKVEFQQTAQAAVQEPVVRQNVMTTIIDKIATAFGKDTAEMTVQLKPEHLGGLSISLSMGESGLVAKMVTSEQSVQHMIHGEIGLLQEALREKGIPVVHMEVSYGQTMNSSANNQGGNGGYWTAPSYTGSGAAYDNTEDPVNYTYNLSSYDVLTVQGGSVEFSA